MTAFAFVRPSPVSSNVIIGRFLGDLSALRSASLVSRVSLIIRVIMCFSQIAANVLNVEPGTLIYEYYFDSDHKAFLYEVYKSDQAAIEHVRNFRGSNWEVRFGEFFSISNFSVLGNSSEELKESLKGYTTDFRTLKGGFHKPAENLGETILEL